MDTFVSHLLIDVEYIASARQIISLRRDKPYRFGETKSGGYRANHIAWARQRAADKEHHFFEKVSYLWLIIREGEIICLFHVFK